MVIANENKLSNYHIVDEIVDLSSAVLKCMSYSNVFDYPLTCLEIHELLSRECSVDEVDQVLNEILLPQSLVEVHSNYYQLPGLRQLDLIRNQRRKYSSSHWKIIKSITHSLKKLPFIKMVAITGSLAVNNSEPNADIDFFVVTKNNRLWLARMILFFYERLLERKFKAHFCFNYIISQDMLEFKQRNEYVAREIVQMKPILGRATYDELLRMNSWISVYFPNHKVSAYNKELQGQKPVNEPEVGGRFGGLFKPINIILDLLDRIEYRRATSKISKNFTLTTETEFGKQVYKAHFSNHQSRVLDILEEPSYR